MPLDPKTLRAMARDLREAAEPLGEPADWDAACAIEQRHETLLDWAERFETRALVAEQDAQAAAQVLPALPPETLTLLGYTFERDYFDSLPNVRGWLARHGIESEPERRGQFAFYARLRAETRASVRVRAVVDVDAGVTALYGVPAT